MSQYFNILFIYFLKKLIYNIFIMKKLIIFFTILLSIQAFAIDENTNNLKVLRVLKDNSPLRSLSNNDANRLTHLYKNTILYSDSEKAGFYRIKLEDDNFVWINKKLAENIEFNKENIAEISKIDFKETKEKYLIKLYTKTLFPYVFKENDNSLNLELYNYNYSKNEPTLSDNIQFLKEDNKINFIYNSSKPLFGYDISPKKYGYLIKIKKSPILNKRKGLKNIKITLDAGHGGVESGVCANNLKEKDINLQITKKLKKDFKKAGAKVYLTRKKDKTVEIYSRVDFAKKKNSDILLSIHQNSLPNWKDVVKKHGVGTYYYHNQSKALAQALKDDLVKATNFKDDNINLRSFVLTRPTSELSVLVECGYLIKKEEAEKLKDDVFQKIISKTIVESVKNYLYNTY